jgi:hypothetical protein
MVRQRKGNDKTKLGRSVAEDEHNLVESISDAVRRRGDTAMVTEVDGAESVIEDIASQRGAEMLFNANKEGCISALALMLIPKEEKQKRRIAAVAQPFGFVIRINKRQRMAVVTPRGYVTDFASIPSAVTWLISPFGKHAEAAVVHDWLYTLGTPGDAKGRRLADKTFVKALRFLGVGWTHRQIMYWSVRIGGASGYGLESDFAFRDLPTLLCSSPPSRDPYRTSYYLEPPPQKVKGGKRAKTTPQAKHDAAEVAVAVENNVQAAE